MASKCGRMDIKCEDKDCECHQDTKKARTDNDHVQIWKVRNLLFVLIKHIGELAANFCTPCHETLEPFVENIYADLHNISDELKINVVDSIYIRHNQLEKNIQSVPGTLYRHDGQKTWCRVDNLCLDLTWRRLNSRCVAI
jgi:hypothetical protein